MTDHDCDAVIIGSGPGGATAADILTAAGWSVISQFFFKCALSSV